MPIAGLDVHKRVVQAFVLDDDGSVRLRARFDCDRESLEYFALNHLGPRCRVALEATTNTWAIVSVLEPLVGEVVVSNPLRTRAIAEARIKTDKVDAEVLARLLAADFLPTVWKPDPATKTLRSLCSRRSSLVSDRTTVKNRIQSVLHQRMIAVSYKDLFGRKGRDWLEKLSLDPLGREAIDSELRLLDRVGEEIFTMEKTIATIAQPDPRARLLMTLPGVSVAVAQTLLAALGDITRFRDGDHAASYLGLVPSTRQSADHTYHGRITKQGNGHARWMLVQAAQHLASHPGPLGNFFRKLSKKKNRNVAVVAVARKLVVIAWHMLTKNEPYRYAIPRTTETKLAKLRVLAGGEKRRTGPRKGLPRPASYGTFAGTRALPSLEQVCEREELPAPKPLADGEKRIVKAAGAEKFVREIHSVRREPRNKGVRAAAAAAAATGAGVGRGVQNAVRATDPERTQTHNSPTPQSANEIQQ